MIINFVIIFSIFLNVILLFILNRKRIKNFLLKSKIDTVDVVDLHEIFHLNKISKNLSGPKKEAIIKSFSISADNQVVGMTSEYEAWIIACLSKISKNILEFGTCSGKTTYLMALNSDENTIITSITLDPNEANYLTKEKKDSKVSFRNIKNESIYDNFLFSNTDCEKKINIIFQNSLEFNELKFKDKMDLIFIDGGHTYSVVKNDSEKAFKMLNSRGIILWHDYVPGKRSSKDIVKYINEISKHKKIKHIKNTSICYFKNN